MLALVLCAHVAAAQGTVMLGQDTRFTKSAGGQILGTLISHTEVTPGRKSGGAVEVTFEGWVRSASLGPIKRDGFNVVITRRSGDALRRTPEGDSIARVASGAGFIKVETKGDWTRVRRAAWIDQKALTAAVAASPGAALPVGTDAGEMTRRVALSTSPGGGTIGHLDSGIVARVVAHAGGWSRVQVEAWIPDSALRPYASGVIVGVSQAEVRANPGKFVGQMIEQLSVEVNRNDVNRLVRFVAASQQFIDDRIKFGFRHVSTPTGKLQPLIQQRCVVPQISEVRCQLAHRSVEDRDP